MNQNKMSDAELTAVIIDFWNGRHPRRIGLGGLSELNDECLNRFRFAYNEFDLVPVSDKGFKEIRKEVQNYYTNRLTENK